MSWREVTTAETALRLPEAAPPRSRTTARRRRPRSAAARTRPARSPAGPGPRGTAPGRRPWPLREGGRGGFGPRSRNLPGLHQEPARLVLPLDLVVDAQDEDRVRQAVEDRLEEGALALDGLLGAPPPDDVRAERDDDPDQGEDDGHRPEDEAAVLPVERLGDVDHLRAGRERPRVDVPAAQPVEVELRARRVANDRNR